MSTIIAVCNQCRTEFEPDRTSIIRGDWRTCPACRPAAAPPPDDAGTRCQRCGRPLKTAGRSICLGCLTGGLGL